MRSAWIPVAVLLTCTCSSGGAKPPIEVREAWARPADSAATTAVYVTIVNNGATAASLVSSSSPSAESAQVHETMRMDGMAHMMAVTVPFSIASGDSLILAPGARHLMVSGLKQRLAAGDSLPILFHFADGREVRAMAGVRAP